MVDPGRRSGGPAQEPSLGRLARGTIHNVEARAPSWPRVPHTLVLPEAKPAEAGKMVREVLERRGALLDEQTHSHVVFEGVEVGGGFKRGGYVGTYQAVGDQRVEVLAQAWATAPRRLFWGTVAAQVVIVLALFAASPPSAVWFLAGLALWAWLGLAALLYYLTFRGSLALEDELASALRERFRGAGLDVWDEEQQLERRIRDKLAGELKQRELATLPPPAPKARPKPPLRAKPARSRGGKPAPEPPVEAPGEEEPRKPRLFGLGRRRA